LRPVLRVGFQNYEVWEWHEICFGKILWNFLDITAALNFLRPFLHYPENMLYIRKLLGRALYCGDVSRLNDHQVLEQFARLLVDRRYRIAELPMHVEGTPRQEIDDEFEPSNEAPAAKPQPVTTRKQILADPEDPLPFDAQLQAAVLKQASLAGVPFCDE
jgi:hypothetical protein